MFGRGYIVIHKYMHIHKKDETYLMILQIHANTYETNNFANSPDIVSSLF